MENETNEKMIRKTWKKWTLVEMRGEHFFWFNDWDLFHLWDWGFWGLVLLNEVGSGLPWWYSGWESACHGRGSKLKPPCHNYWAGALEFASCSYWDCELRLLKPMCLELVPLNKRSHCNEKPSHGNRDPAQPTKKKKKKSLSPTHSHGGKINEWSGFRWWIFWGLLWGCVMGPNPTHLHIKQARLIRKLSWYCFWRSLKQDKLRFVSHQCPCFVMLYVAHLHIIRTLRELC